jgi:hypothetical protein
VVKILLLNIYMSISCYFMLFVKQVVFYPSELSIRKKFSSIFSKLSSVLAA